MEFFTILKIHLERYPCMRPEDIFKLLYQHHNGPGHAVNNEEDARQYLLDETAMLERTGKMLLEPIGNGLSRLHLAALPAGMEDTAVKLFMQTAAVFVPDRDSFLRDFHALADVIDQYPVSFGCEEYIEAAERYEKLGCPAIHHSSVYREVYNPHYRIVFHDPAERLLGGKDHGCMSVY